MVPPCNGRSTSDQPVSAVRAVEAGSRVNRQAGGGRRPCSTTRQAPRSATPANPSARWCSQSTNGWPSTSMVVRGQVRTSSSRAATVRPVAPACWVQRSVSSADAACGISLSNMLVTAVSATPRRLPSAVQPPSASGRQPRRAMVRTDQAGGASAGVPGGGTGPTLTSSHQEGAPGAALPRAAASRARDRVGTPAGTSTGTSRPASVIVIEDDLHPPGTRRRGPGGGRPALRSPTMGPLALFEVTLDCPEPRALAGFYRRALGWAYAPGHELHDPDGDEWLVLLPPGGGTR